MSHAMRILNKWVDKSLAMDWWPSAKDQAMGKWMEMAFTIFDPSPKTPHVLQAAAVQGTCRRARVESPKTSPIELTPRTTFGHTWAWWIFWISEKKECLGIIRVIHFLIFGIQCLHHPTFTGNAVADGILWGFFQVWVVSCSVAICDHQKKNHGH